MRVKNEALGGEVADLNRKLFEEQIVCHDAKKALQKELHWKDFVKRNGEHFQHQN